MKKSFLLASLVSGLIALPGFAALEEGNSAPTFTAQASLDGQEFTYSLQDSLNNGPTVVYFYPSAFTRGCNIQAKTFADNMDRFREAGASVVGVSLDSIERLNDFSADPEYCAGELPVVSDESGSIAQSYDLDVAAGRDGMLDTRGVEIGHGFAERTTFVVNTDGSIAAVVGGVSPEENVMQSLAVIQGMSM
ncbi:MAG: peroxiredoxin [Gammaproteobacteria bacterium]|nr:peroxiredoxin [Gammaproteobacteria bacterium]MAY03413.1 peroxiredoxin [Gammaproteobacteria bacterium]|tara:strand:+ start:741 stop:1316 length:576 start_codon:yes stop_codon:yes gene_type:complete